MSKEDISPEAKLKSAASNKKTLLLTSGASLLMSTYSLDEIFGRIKEETEKPLKDQNYAQLSILFNEWVKHSPLEALDYAQEQGKDDWILEGLRIAGQKYPDEALEWIKGSSKDLFRRLYLEESVYIGLAQVNPHAAIARLEQKKEGESKERLMLPVLTEWAIQDVDAVFNWIDARESGSLKERAYESILFTYLNNNPGSETMSFISSMDENMDKVNFANRAAFVSSSTDRSETIKWVEEQEGATKQFAMMGLIEQWSQSDDATGALEYVKNLPSSIENEEAFAMVSYQLSQDDPDSLAEQLSSLDEQKQVTVARHLAQTYSNHDAEKAYEWLGTLPEGAPRDAAIASSLLPIQYSDITKAFELSESLSDSTARQNEVLNTLKVWVSTDPAAAYDALNNTAVLEASTKDKIRQLLARESIATPDYILPAAK